MPTCPLSSGSVRVDYGFVLTVSEDAPLCWAREITPVATRSSLL